MVSDPASSRPDVPPGTGPDVRPDVRRDLDPDADPDPPPDPPGTLPGGSVNRRPAGFRSLRVGSAQATDEHLIRELYEAHAGMLLGYVRRLLGGDQARAEDVVQETLLRAWRHPQALDPSRPGGVSVRAWLLTVARHLVIDGERARRARPMEVPHEGDGAGLPPDAGHWRTVDDELDRILLSHEMADALQALSPDHRAVIEQVYYLDRSVAETADALGVPEGTVKSRAYYALRALRIACEERGIVP